MSNSPSTGASTTRNAPCGVSCRSPGAKRSGAVSVALPKPMSASHAAVQIDAQQHVRLRGDGLGRPHPAHARDQRRDAKAERRERRVEQLVQFEAIAAAAARDDLGDDRRHVERDARAGQRIEVFERDRLRMQQMQAAQHVERRLGRAVVADAGEVARKVERVSHEAAPEAENTSR
jgi:hypothetical protein